ncbi:MAG TPA: hypothetical protein VG722_09535 [Tepidisphaeraceae bacterium]|nr:hypothetical protein [Tepidisphaeraceae bacterium]
MQPFFVDPININVGNFLKDKHWWEEQVANYIQNCAAIDLRVGKVLGGPDSRPIYDAPCVFTEAEGSHPWRFFIQQCHQRTASEMVDVLTRAHAAYRQLLVWYHPVLKAQYRHNKWVYTAIFDNDIHCTISEEELERRITGIENDPEFKKRCFRPAAANALCKAVAVLLRKHPHEVPIDQLGWIIGNKAPVANLRSALPWEWRYKYCVYKAGPFGSCLEDYEPTLSRNLKKNHVIKPNGETIRRLLDYSRIEEDLRETSPTLSEKAIRSTAVRLTSEKLHMSPEALRQARVTWEHYALHVLGRQGSSARFPTPEDLNICDRPAQSSDRQKVCAAPAKSATRLNDDHDEPKGLTSEGGKFLEEVQLEQKRRFEAGQSGDVSLIDAVLQQVATKHGLSVDELIERMRA